MRYPFILALALLACSGSPPPNAQPAIDLGTAIAVELCKREAPRQKFDPALCVAGGEFLKPYIEEAGRQAFAALQARTVSVESVPAPCPPSGGFQDTPAPAPMPPVPAGGGATQ